MSGMEEPKTFQEPCKSTARNYKRLAKREKASREGEFYFSFREAIRKEMRAQGLTLKAFAERLGKDKGYVSRALNPVNNISISTLFDMAEALKKKWSYAELEDVKELNIIEAYQLGKSVGYETKEEYVVNKILSRGIFSKDNNILLSFHEKDNFSPYDIINTRNIK